jgi:hypothetical protein
MSFVRTRAWLVAVTITIGVGVVSCSVPFGPSGATVSVSLAMQQPSASAPRLLVSVGERVVSLRASDTLFRTVDTKLETTQFGSFPVKVTLMDGGADTLATMAYTQTFERGSKSWIASYVSRTRPVGFCTGTVLAAPLRNASRDSLFVMYGSLPEGAIC